MIISLTISIDFYKHTFYNLITNVNEVNSMPTAFGYRSSKLYNPIPSGHPVCAAVTYNTRGKMRIDAFGAEISSIRFRYKVKSCQLIKDHQGVCVFNCTYVEMGLTKAVRLQFYTATCLWTVL